MPPRGYPEEGREGRYTVIENKLGRSDPQVWRQERTKPLFLNFKTKPSLLELARETRRALAKERRIGLGPSCKECGSGIYPHTCW